MRISNRIYIHRDEQQDLEYICSNASLYQFGCQQAGSGTPSCKLVQLSVINLANDRRSCLALTRGSDPTGALDVADFSIETHNSPLYDRIKQAILWTATAEGNGSRCMPDVYHSLFLASSLRRSKVLVFQEIPRFIGRRVPVQGQLINIPVPMRRFSVVRKRMQSPLALPIRLSVDYMPLDPRVTKYVPKIEPVPSSPVPLHVTPVLPAWYFVFPSSEIVLHFQRLTTHEMGVSIVTIAQIVGQSVLAVSPMSPRVSMGAIVPLLLDPYVGPFVGENIFPSPPAMRAFLILVPWPDHLPLAFKICFRWATG